MEKSKIILGFSSLVIIGGILVWSYPQKNTFKIPVQSPPSEETQSTEPDIKQFGIKIEKIGVLAPVVENVDGTDKSVYNKALEKGLAHYKNTSLPGSGSNIFIFGHSSTILGRGPYATIFARLNYLQNGDLVIINYKGREYKYTVFEKKIVSKNDVSVVRPTLQEQLTLMTCWPIGSDLKRLIIIAR